MSKSLIQVGNTVLIRTVTFFQVGKIVEVDDKFVTLEKASWVADTGRFGECLKTGKISESEPFADGVATVGLGAIVDIARWDHDLPTGVI